MNYGMIISLMGKIMLIGAGVLVAPLAVSAIYGDGQIMAFVYTIAIFLALGIIGCLVKPKKKDIYAKEGMVIVSLTWILFSAIGGLPFLFSGQIPNFVDCIFETASGFTTTGSTILTDVEAMSKSLLFWRSLTHWIGGMGVLVFVTAIFSDRSTRTSHIMRAEMPGPTLGKIASKWQFSVRILYGIYIGMTVLMFVLLLFGGMDVFDSMVHTFGAAGTGGFGIKNASMGYYNSAYIDYVIAVFMMLFAVNFNIYYFMLTRQFDLIKVNSELKAYLGIVAASVILIAINIMPIYSTASESLRYSFFQVSSVISTTGYATDDFCKWPVFSQMILLMLMFVGGCAGSTGGGIKVIRISIIWKCAVNEVKKSINPRRVLSVKNDGKPLDNAVVHGVMGYMMVYLAVMVLSMVVVSIDNFDLTTVSTAVITALNNIGPGLGMVGPTGNFSEFSVLSKLVLTFDMLAGRLELFSMIAVFMPSVWRRR